MANVKKYTGNGELPGQPLGYTIYLAVEVDADTLKADWNTLYAEAISVGTVSGAEVKKTDK